MKKSELKKIIEDNPGWVSRVIYGNNTNKIVLLYGPDYCTDIKEDEDIPELLELYLNPEKAYPVYVDIGGGDYPDYRVYIPKEWEKEYMWMVRG